MADESPQASGFKRFTQAGSGDEAHFFLHCRLHEDAGDFEASALDLTVSSLRRGWRGTGLQRPTTKHAHALRRIHEALTTTDDAGGAQTRVKLTPKGGTLQVQCIWQEAGQTVSSTHPPLELAEEGSGEGALSSIFDALLHKCAALEAGSQGAESSAPLERLEQLERLQQQQTRFLDEQGSRDDELYAKFAVLLNEKKLLIRSLQAELAEARSAAAPATALLEPLPPAQAAGASSAADNARGSVTTSEDGTDRGADDDESSEVEADTMDVG